MIMLPFVLPELVPKVEEIFAEELYKSDPETWHQFDVKNRLEKDDEFRLFVCSQRPELREFMYQIMFPCFSNKAEDRPDCEQLVKGTAQFLNRDAPTEFIVDGRTVVVE